VRLECYAPRTRRQLSPHPEALLDGSEQTCSLTAEASAKLTADLVPGNRWNGARIKISNPERDFVSPSFFGVLIDFGVEAINKGAGECRPRCWRQF
jgi:hypothetical protein